MAYTKEEMKQAGKTARSSGAVGMKAIVPDYVATKYGDNKSRLILDFGAGKGQATKWLMEEEGFRAVYSYDFYNDSGVYKEEDPFNFSWDMVFASNVLNVQSSRDMMRRTLYQVWNLLNRTYGVFVANYPASPRKSDMTFDEVVSIIKEVFLERTVEVVPYRSSKVIIVK